MYSEENKPAFVAECNRQLEKLMSLLSCLPVTPENVGRLTHLTFMLQLHIDMLKDGINDNPNN